MELNNCLKQIIRFKCENKPEAALHAAESAYKIFNDDCYLYQIYECYLKMGKVRDAIKALIRLSKKSNCKGELYKKIAFHYFCISKFKDALKFYKLILKDEISSSNYYNVACAYHYMNKLKQAEKFYIQSLSLDSNNVSAMNNLGLLFYQKKKWQPALSLFERAIKTNPNHPEAYHHIGIIKRKFLKEFRDSELYIKKAIRLDPVHAENYYELTYIECGKKDDALLMLKKCAELKPAHKEALKLIKKLS